jgi:hypothetical protein
VTRGGRSCFPWLIFFKSIIPDYLPSARDLCFLDLAARVFFVGSLASRIAIRSTQRSRFLAG